MRKPLITLLFITAVSAANAQKIGIHVAGILPSQTIKSSGLSINSSSRFSWKAGVVGDFGLPGGHIHLMPQVNVLSKGSKFNFGGAELKSNLTYVEVPVLVTYNVSRFFIGLGPSFAFGIGGKETQTSAGQTVSADVKFDGKENTGADNYSHYKASDIGGQIIAGVNLPLRFFANIHYSFGFSNISPDTQGTDASQKNKYFGFGIGKYFGK